MLVVYLKGASDNNDLSKILANISQMTLILIFVITIIMQLVGIIISKKLDDTPSVGGICAAGEFYQILLDTIPIFIMIVIFETAIYPFFKACIPSMFRRIGLGMGVAIAGLLLLFIVDVFGYYKLRHTSNLDSNSTAFVENSCYLVNGTTEQQVDISVHIMPAPILLAALAETLVFISSMWRVGYTIDDDCYMCDSRG